jgi:LysM repeat protein
MKKLMTVASLLFIYSFVFSQDLVLKSGSKGMYLEHKVAAKEGLFPLGRMYNVHPRHIANFNGIDFNKGLAIGQKINIPLTDTNFKQNVNKGVPVYYVTEKESLANISVKSKAQIWDLRGWNNLTADNVSAGTKLIVGF